MSQKENNLIFLIMITFLLLGAGLLYSDNYSNHENRKVISVDVLFFD